MLKQCEVHEFHYFFVCLYNSHWDLALPGSLNLCVLWHIYYGYCPGKSRGNGSLLLSGRELCGKWDVVVIVRAAVVLDVAAVLVISNVPTFVVSSMMDFNYQLSIAII